MATSCQNASSHYLSHERIVYLVYPLFTLAEFEAELIEAALDLFKYQCNQ